MSSISIIRLQDRPELKDLLSRWFHEKWGVPLEAYQEVWKIAWLLEALFLSGLLHSKGTELSADLA